VSEVDVIRRKLCSHVLGLAAFLGILAPAAGISVQVPMVKAAASRPAGDCKGGRSSLVELKSPSCGSFFGVASTTGGCPSRSSALVTLRRCTSTPHRKRQESDLRTGTIYLGFTDDPNGMVQQFKQEVSLIAPSHLRPFPIPPIYTERELSRLQEKVWPSRGPLINFTTVNVLANKVEVGTEHVHRVRRLLADRFGFEALIPVVFEKPLKEV
jgi:hypothetical protein